MPFQVVEQSWHARLLVQFLGDGIYVHIRVTAHIHHVEAVSACATLPCLILFTRNSPHWSPPPTEALVLYTQAGHKMEANIACRTFLTSIKRAALATRRQAILARATIRNAGAGGF